MSFTDDKLHQHMKRRVIYISLLVAMLLDFIPFPQLIDAWLPPFLPLMLLYWGLYRPQNVSIGTAFFLGLVTDIVIGTPFGLHALIYIAAVYLLQRNIRLIGAQPYGFQSLGIWGLLTGMQLALIAADFVTTRRTDGWVLLIAPFTAALLWPLLNKLMLYIVRRRGL